MRAMAPLWFRVVLVLAVLFPAAVLQAQPSRGRQRPRPRVQFRLPKPGTPLPKLTVYDEQGKPVPLQSLRGSWTVLVFGCLT